MMISTGLPALNISELNQHWPKWKQRFEIYIVAAYNNQLDDRQKLALLLHFLGPDGLEIVNGWFDQLKNFNSPPAMEVSFSDVWNKLHEYCQSGQKPSQKKLVVDTPVVKSVFLHPARDNRVATKKKATPTVKKVVVDKPVVKLVLDPVHDNGVKETTISTLDINFLCEIEAFISEDPNRRSSVYGFLSKGHKLSIDSSTIDRYPIEEHKPMYVNYGVHTKNLEITEVEESDIQLLLAIFPGLTQLTLQSVSIVGDNLTKYPLMLHHLRLVQCKSHNLFDWLNIFSPSLETLHLEEVYGFSSTQLAKPFGRLTSLTMIGSQEYSRGQFPICPAVETLYLDAPKAVNYFSWTPQSALKSITLNHCWPDVTSHAYQMIKRCRKLQNLTILNEVDPQRTQEIKKMRLKKVNVKYAKGSAKKTMILDLNLDCMLHLLDFLPNEDWRSLRLVNTEFNRLISSRQTYYIDGTSLRANPSHSYYHRIGSRVTKLFVGDMTADELHSVFIHFKNLRALDLSPGIEINEYLEYPMKNGTNIQIFKAISYRMNMMSWNMKRLKTLKIYMDEKSAQSFTPYCLPMLEHLSFNGNSRCVDLFLNRLDGQKLRTIENLPLDTQRNFVKARFPNIKKCTRKK